MIEKFFANRSIFLLWTGTLVIKLALAWALPLANDECYYWVWSQNLQLSYFDHPGMVAWLFRIGSFFEFLGGSAVRWPAVILAHIGLIFWVQILRKMTDPKSLFWSIALMCAAPLVGIGSIILTPDLPLVLFWTTSIFFTYKYLEEPSHFLATCLGLSLGFGFCSKYHIVLFVPSLIVGLMLSKDLKKIQFSHVFTVILSGLAASSPVLIWNYNNDFSSFKFQLHHGLGRNYWKSRWTISYIIGQFFLILPIPLYWAISSWKNSNQSKNRILHGFSWVPLFFFLISSFKSVVEANWPIISYPSIYALAGQNRRSIWSKISIGIWISMLSILLSQIVFHWIPGTPDKLREFSYYEPVIPAFSRYTPIFAESYQMASFVSYNKKVIINKLKFMSRQDFFDTLPGAEPTTYPIYVVMDKEAGLPKWLADKNPIIENVESLSDIFVVRRITLR